METDEEDGFDDTTCDEEGCDAEAWDGEACDGEECDEFEDEECDDDEEFDMTTDSLQGLQSNLIAPCLHYKHKLRSGNHVEK